MKPKLPSPIFRGDNNKTTAATETIKHYGTYLFFADVRLYKAWYFKCYISGIIRAKPDTTSSLGIVIPIFHTGSSFVGCGFFSMFCYQWVLLIPWVCTFSILISEDSKIM